MLTNMSEIMSKKISVLDISIDNFTAKEAMREALAYMESDLVSVIELVTIESLMELGTEAELKEEIENFNKVYIVACGTAYHAGTLSSLERSSVPSSISVLRCAAMVLFTL